MSLLIFGALIILPNPNNMSINKISENETCNENAKSLQNIVQSFQEIETLNKLALATVETDCRNRITEFFHKQSTDTLNKMIADHHSECMQKIIKFANIIAKEQNNDSNMRTEKHKYFILDEVLHSFVNNKQGHISCVFCGLYAFIPIMFDYVATWKDRDTQSRQYYKIFTVMCYKCHHTNYKDLQKDLPGESRYLRNRTILSFNEDSEVIDYCWFGGNYWDKN